MSETRAKRLPVVGSTASSTAFILERVDGLGDTHLYVDGNSKITRGNGTFESPRPNAFSLVQVETCPGSTPTCRSSCYVHSLEKAQQEIHAAYRHNTETIREILADEILANDWAMRLASWITLNAPGGFRWHVSGDVFSLEYAKWIADVCREAPTVPFWIYTRSFEFLAPLVEVCTFRGGGNLAINLSADQDNYVAAVSASLIPGEVPPLTLAYLTTDGSLPEALCPTDVVFPDYSLRPRQYATLAESPWWQALSADQRAMVCPVDSFGKSEKRRCGPCARCL